MHSHTSILNSDEEVFHKQVSLSVHGAIWLILLPSKPNHRFLLGLFSVSGLTPWWRHQMEAFSALLAICAGNSPVPGEFHAQRPVTRSFDVFFDLRLNKRLGKQSWGWWFWRHLAHYDVNVIALPPNLEAERLIFRLSQLLWNMAAISAIALSRWLSNFRAMRLLLHPISRLRGFESSRDLMRSLSCPQNNTLIAQTFTV